MDYYAQHLAKVGEYNRVNITAPIQNESGALVANIGTPLTEDLAEKISRHRLTQRLDLSVALEEKLTGNDIVSYLINERQHPEAKALLAKRIAIDDFEREASKLANYPLLLQKLTVLKNRLPRIYDNAVVGAYLTILIANEMKLTGESLHVVFVAAIARDVGYLHIDPELVNSDAILTPDQWNTLQAHVVIGYQFLSIVPKMPKAVLQAVAQHHERTDGLGYPKQSMAHELCLEGQIVAFADMTLALFARYIASSNYTINALEPVFQLSAGIHTRRVTKAALRAIDTCFEPTTERLSKLNIGEHIPTLLRRQSYIRNWFAIAVETNQALSKHLDQTVHDRSTAFLSRVEGVLVQSGVTDDLFVEWLKNVDSQQLLLDDVLDIEHFALMLNEAAFQFNASFLAISVMIQPMLASASQEARDEVASRSSLLRELLTRFHNDVV